MAQVEYTRYLKNISYFIVLLVSVFLFNYSILNIIVNILFMLYDIYLFIYLYGAYLDKNGPVLSISMEKLSLALIFEPIIIITYNLIYSDSIFWTKNTEVIISPNIFSLIISISYNLSLIIRNNAKISIKSKYLIIFLLNIIFFAILISIFISNNNFYLPLYGETNITYKTFYSFLIIFPWTSFKSLNILIYPLMVLLSILRLGKIYKVFGSKAIFLLLYFYILYIVQFCINYLKEDEYKDFFNKFKSELFSKKKKKLNNIPSGRIRYQIFNLKNRQIINVKLKSVYENILYNVNINNDEKISELKQQLIKKNDNYKNNNIILLFRGRILNADDYINSYRIENGDCILFLLR